MSSWAPVMAAVLGAIVGGLASWLLNALAVRRRDKKHVAAERLAACLEILRAAHQFVGSLPRSQLMGVLQGARKRSVRGGDLWAVRQSFYDIRQAIYRVEATGSPSLVAAAKKVDKAMSNASPAPQWSQSRAPVYVAIDDFIAAMRADGLLVPAAMTPEEARATQESD